jgi:hypothetical protein
LTSATGSILGSPNTAVLTITNDDTNDVVFNAPGSLVAGTYGDITVNSPAVPLDMTTIRPILMRPLALDERHGSCYDPRRYGDCTPDSPHVPAHCCAGVLNYFATADPAPTARRRFLLGVVCHTYLSRRSTGRELN